MMEHPDIERAERDGWPLGAERENRDWPEYRAEFAREEFEDFLAFVQAGQPDVLEDFVAHYRWKYDAWLN